MKRSNLFLALTTGCLAVASFAFAKTHQRGGWHTGFCTNPSNGKCTVQTQGVAPNGLTTVSGGQTNGHHCSGTSRTAHTGTAVVSSKCSTKKLYTAAD